MNSGEILFCNPGFISLQFLGSFSSFLCPLPELTPEPGTQRSQKELLLCPHDSHPKRFQVEKPRLVQVCSETSGPLGEWGSSKDLNGGGVQLIHVLRSRNRVGRGSAEQGGCCDAPGLRRWPWAVTLFEMASAEKSTLPQVMPGNLPHPVAPQHGDIEAQPAHPSSG